jgi:hypothetical protein
LHDFAAGTGCGKYLAAAVESNTVWIKPTGEMSYDTIVTYLKDGIGQISGIEIVRDCEGDSW